MKSKFNCYRYRSYAAVMSVGCLLGCTMSNSLMAKEPGNRIQWAIAIHGGAGGNPAKWNDQKRQARTRGLQQALTKGKDILADGGTALDAVEAVINVLEDNASFNAGRGAVVTEDGTVELDASIMDGKTGNCGAVAAVTTVKNPISLARLVMTKTKHVLLAGPGADEFAGEQKVPLVPSDYFLSRSNSNQTQAPTKIGTVGCVALDSDGNLAAGTSTGGTSQKLPGRVGDSPIVGAGTFAANGAAAVSGTGIGEQYIRNAVAYDIIAQLRYTDRSLEAAVTEIMTRRLNPDDGGLICVSQTGQIVMQHNTPGLSCGAADSSGRFETFLELEKGGQTVKQTDPSAEETIANLIHQQAVDWNEGDIDQFMKVYWRSEQLTFASGGKVTRGWEATLAGYKKRYPDKKTMGKLTFSDLEFLPLGQSAMQVMGVWNLQRDEPVGGRFTLIWRRLPEGWRIVHDHTSVQTD